MGDASGMFGGFGAMHSLHNAHNQQMSGMNQQQWLAQQQSFGNRPIYSPNTDSYQNSPARETKVNNELLPDISLARVFKWAIVLVVAMALGRKVWDQFGPAITTNMHKALGSIDKDPAA